MYDTFKLSGKRTLTGQNSGKFFNKHRRGNFPSVIGGKNLSGTKTEQEYSLNISILSFLF